MLGDLFGVHPSICKDGIQLKQHNAIIEFTYLFRFTITTLSVVLGLALTCT